MPNISTLSLAPQTPVLMLKQTPLPTPKKAEGQMDMPVWDCNHNTRDSRSTMTDSMEGGWNMVRLSPSMKPKTPVSSGWHTLISLSAAYSSIFCC